MQNRNSRTRETRTRKESLPSCKRYSTCDRPEKNMDRCNPRKCPGYKKKKK